MCKWGPRHLGKGVRWAGGDFGDRVRDPDTGMRDPDVRTGDLGGD